MSRGSSETLCIIGVVSDAAWRQIRALRAAPPMLAQDARRRAVFGAALQQSQELFDAATAVGPASKPLPLFYALSQAGRAITAAHNPDHTTWAVRGHGLVVRVNTEDVRDTIVKANASRAGNDAPSSVAAALASAPLSGSMTLAALVAALPELRELVQLRGAAVPALEITPEAELPHWMHTRLPPARGTLHVQVPDSESIDTVLAAYAGVDGYEHVVPPASLGETGWQQVLLSWPARSAQHAPPGSRSLRHLSDVADRVDGRWYLRPRLGLSDEPPRRLLVWWALLLGLSSLARYQPAEWVAALDVDRCVLAVDLEETVRVAEREVPKLIATALGTSGQAPHPWRREALARLRTEATASSRVADVEDNQ